MKIINREYDPAVSVKAITPHPANPRRGNTDVIASSIEANGFFGACIVQRSSGHILVGNHRYRSACAQGSDVVPVIWVDVDDETAVDILLSDNRANDLARYDEGSLLELIEQVNASERGLIGTGYSAEDMNRLIEAVGVPGFDIPAEKSAGALEKNLASMFGAAGLAGGVTQNPDPNAQEGGANEASAQGGAAAGDSGAPANNTVTSHVRMLQVFVANDAWEGLMSNLAVIQKQYQVLNNSDAVIKAAELVAGGGVAAPAAEAECE